MHISQTHLVSFVNCLSNWLEGTSIQIRSADEEAETMLQETTKFIDIIRPFLEPDAQACILRAVHSLLRTRNISCLQISYYWLVSKLQLAENGPVDSETTLFVLAGLSDIGKLLIAELLSVASSSHLQHYDYFLHASWNQDWVNTIAVGFGSINF